MDEETQYQSHVSVTIPAVTVTSLGSDDALEKRKSPRQLKQSGSDVELVTSGEKHKICRPTYLPIHFSNGESDAADTSSHSIEDECVGDSQMIAVESSELVGTIDMKALIGKSPTSSLKNVTLLTPGSEYDSDFGPPRQPLSDLEDDSTNNTRLISPAVVKDRAESDPCDTAKKGKKSLKSLKTSFKAMQRKRGSDSASKLHIAEELALASIRLQSEVKPKVGKSKLENSKHKTKRKIAKMTKMLSDKQVLSPSYKQKNEDFHKFFKDLPATERLLVDYACALVKDILVQGRLYVSQNYVCFHSTILKWQTAVTVNLVDIDQMTKEKTVKVIPNAIQILLKDKAKITFTSFTARDRAYLAIFRLWQNALLDKPMSANELWSQIHRNYGEELGGCSSDDDYVRPKRLPKKHQGIGDDNELTYEFGTTNKVKRSSNAAETLKDGDCDRSIKSQSSSRDSPIKERQGDGSTGDDKSSHSSRDTGEDLPLAENTVELDETDSVKPEQLQGSGLTVEPMEVRNEEPEESDNESADFLMHNLPKHAFTRTYNTSVRNMYRIIFSDDCPFWKQTLVNKGTTGITFGTWKKDDSTPTQHVRELSYTLRLDNSFGPKTSFVKETQTYYLCSVEGKSYVVDCIAQNYGIPYADYFFTAMRYCVRKVARNSCELRVTWELKYKKSPWGLVKNFIEKNVNSGMSENFKKLQKQLQDQIDLEKSESQLYDNRSSAKSSSVRRRKRKSTSSTANTSQSKTKSSSEAPRNEDGRDLSVSEVESSRKRASSSVVTGVPPIYTPNGFIPNEVRTHESEAPKLHYFGQGGKFIFGAILFLFILLLYSNYNMSQRLNTLEQVTAAAATADGVDPAVTAALLDRPGVPITSNPEILSSYLQAIDKRLRRLEDAVIKFTEESNSKWERIEMRWETIEALVKHLSKSSVSKSP